MLKSLYGRSENCFWSPGDERGRQAEPREEEDGDWTNRGKEVQDPRHWKLGHAAKKTQDPRRWKLGRVAKKMFDLRRPYLRCAPKRRQITADYMSQTPGPSWPDQPCQEGKPCNRIAGEIQAQTGVATRNSSQCLGDTMKSLHGRSENCFRSPGGEKGKQAGPSEEEDSDRTRRDEEDAGPETLEAGTLAEGDAGPETLEAGDWT
ncbi:hypothetical protein NDU88_006854 [Pleurodeles waltl]|uniref:Uncharacterized protein n=1 Tax=Pleurodeles waltl TaxID=8319 RepID=A0AAV7UMA5_PLEWA|nr:hypothetical protein NDU88_006854 [Pleurodeles waltl]